MVRIKEVTVVNKEEFTRYDIVQERRVVSKDKGTIEIKDFFVVYDKRGNKIDEADTRDGAVAKGEATRRR